MNKKGKQAIFALSLLILTSSSFASEITITETIIDQAPGWVKLGFNITNNSTLLIEAFAIGNDNDVSNATVPDSSVWDGYPITRGGNGEWPTTYGETEGSSPPINLDNGDLAAYNGAFFYYTADTSAAIQPGQSLYVTGETGWLDSSFVAFAHDTSGGIVRFTGQTTVVPLPASFLLFLSGLAGLWGFSKKKEAG